jgi:thiamine pyrophosphokinase
MLVDEASTTNFWDPLDGLDALGNRPGCGDGRRLSNMALIILNQPIEEKNELKLVELWKKAQVKFCVDGGANRLYHWSLRRRQQQQGQNIPPEEANDDDHNEYIPDYICGDLDSIEENIKTYYVERGTLCIRLQNQDLTDFTKTLKFAVNCISKGIMADQDLAELALGMTKNETPITKQAQIDVIYCFCDFTGRFDHALSNLSSLYDKCLLDVPTYMVSAESVTFLLRPGDNVIFIDHEHLRGKNCGFFALGEPAHVTTRGFKWNLDQKCVQFGSFISSSNEFTHLTVNDLRSETSTTTMTKWQPQANRKCAFIRTDKPVLFTMSVEL